MGSIDALGAQRGHPAIRDPARHDVAEHGQVGAHVERDAVECASPPGTGAQRAYADGGDLAGVRAAGVEPDARVLALARRPVQTEVGQRRDDDLLQAVHVLGASGGVVGHRDDRVGHELTRPVVGDVTATVGPLEDGADRHRIDQHVALVGVRTQRVGVRVRQDQQVVVDGLGREGMLERVGLVVGNRPERPDV